MASGNYRTKWPFTFVWTINNFHKYLVTSLKSPAFVAGPLDKTKWTLTLCVPSWDDLTKDSVTCILQRDRDDSRNGDICIDFMISIMDLGGVLHSVRKNNCVYGKKSTASGKNLIQIKTLRENLNKYVPGSALTLRCRMYKCHSTISRTDLCFARTIIDVEKRNFFWTIEDISLILPGQKRTINVPHSGKGSSSLQLDFCLKQNYDGEEFSIEMYEMKNLKQLYCAISLLNDKIKKVKDWVTSFRHIKFKDKKCVLYDSLISPEDLLDDEKHFLTNDTLALRFDFELSFGVSRNLIENYKPETFETGSDVEIIRTYTPSCPSSCPSKKFLEHLLNEGTLSDITLRAGNKSFPVHKNILGARSHVFRSMFIKEEGQNPRKVLNLPDIDEVTLNCLLVYIYKDTVEDLNIETAFSLFQSAEKYQLMELKNICTKFLTANISRSNIFRILSFAKTNQDSIMIKAAQDFIAEIGNNFISSDQWEDFKKRNLELAMETLEYMYSRKRRRS